MKRSKGMTLIELLIAMGISVLIMAATFIIVRYSANTYDDTARMVHDNNNRYDAINVINRYIRSSYFCTVSDDGNSLYLMLDDENFGGTYGNKHTVMIALDDVEEVLVIDRLDGSAYSVISDKVYRVEWEIMDNGVRYTAYSADAVGIESKIFDGFACKRGR